MAKGGGFDVRIDLFSQESIFDKQSLVTEASSGKELSMPEKSVSHNSWLFLTQQDESAVFVTPNVNKIITFNHINTGKELSMDFSIHHKIEGEMSRVGRGDSTNTN